MRLILSPIILILIFFSLVSAQEVLWEDKISDKVWFEIDKAEGSVSVIIMMGDQLVIEDTKSIKGKAAKANYVYNALKKHSESSQAGLKKYFQENNIDYRSFKIVNAIALRANLDLLKEIAKRDEVGAIKHDGIVPLTKVSQENEDLLELRAGEPEWGIKMIKADSVWDQFGVMGNGVVVGGQDTGYKWDLPQIKSMYRGNTGGIVDHNYNWHDAVHSNIPNTANMLNPCGYDVDIPCDDHNHGTHTMGTMVGSDSVYQIGVAPEAQWIGCRNMDRGNGKPSSYTECFEWFLAPTDLNGENPDPSKGPHVINNSWGCPDSEGCNTDNFEMMNIVIQNLRAGGIVVVVSAGNSGSSCFTVRDPAAIFEGSFTVGASNIRDTIAGLSSRGIVTVDGSLRMKPNVVAPGIAVRSILRDSTFASWNGTSMAGPHVAGAVALLISAVPDLAGEVDLIEDIIEETAAAKFSTQTCETDSLAYPNPTYGFGRIDVLAAVKRAQILVGVSEPIDKNIDFSISPNPTTDFLEFSFGQSKREGSIQIFNSNGKEVLKKNVTDNLNRIDLTSFISGHYIVMFTSKEGNRSRKLIILE